MKIEDVKQGSIVKTEYGMMVVVNADFKKKTLQGYEIRTKGNKPYVVLYRGDEVEVVEDFTK